MKMCLPAAVLLTSSLLVGLASAQVTLPPAADGISPMGICWGRVSHAPIPEMPVVSMLEKNPYIARVKLFNADGVVLSALASRGTNVEVMIMVRNGDLEAIATDDAAADGWLYANVLANLPTGVNIKYISVGNEPYLGHFQAFDDYLLLAFNRLYQALVRAKLETQIRLTVSFNSEILGASSSVSSNGSFVKQWADEIKNMTTIMSKTGSFFSVNIYPFFTYKDQPDISLDFILFGSNAKPVVDKGNNKTYLNILDASYDALVAALTKIGFSTLEIRIGEIGWPSDGHPNATLQLAQTFNQRAIKHLLSGAGTPVRPGVITPFYLFGLFDEDAKGVKAGAFERRWGLYDDLGAAKYNLDLSGGGNPSATLPEIPGLVVMQRRWCKATPKLTSDPNAEDNAVTLNSLVSKICGDDPTASGDYSDTGDCTPAFVPMSSPGLQCELAANTSAFPLGYTASYALNVQYQAAGQAVNACTWNGYGVVTYDDPSTTGQCTFQVGLDIPAIEAYYQPSTKWSWEVFGYLVAMIVVLSTFL